MLNKREAKQQGEARRDYIRCLLLRGSTFAPPNLEQLMREAKTAMEQCTCLRRLPPDRWHSRDCPAHIVE